MEGHKELFGIPVDDGKKILLVNESQECIKKATGVPAQIIHEMEPVDEFLVEALQNPRQRLTILRLEQEILKFRSNTQLQQLQFLPMPSSFTRLATHRVARHYHMRTGVVDDGSGCRIIVWKVPETGRPVARLASMYPEVAEELKPKVAIKQRPTGAGFTANGGIVKITGKMDSTRSVEERKEEYDKARARIFQEELGEDSVRVCCHIEVVRVEDHSSKVNDTSPASKSDKENMSRGKRDHSSTITSATSNSNVMSNDNANDNANANANANINTSTNTNHKPKVNTRNRVAIFRDREKDSKDPDYDRSYDRYLQRREVSIFPGYNMHFDQSSWVAHPAYERFPVQQWIYPASAYPSPRMFQNPRYQPASYVQSRH